MKKRTVDLTILLVVLYFVFALFLSSDDLSIKSPKIYDYSSDWNYEDVVIDLPADVEVSTGGVYSITKKTTSDLNNLSLRLRLSMQYLNVYIDDELYIGYEPLETNVALPEASIWRIVNLPENMTDKKLTLEFYTPINVFSGTLNEIKYGTSDALLRELVTSRIGGIVIGGFLMMMGIGALLSSILLEKYSDRRLYYLGVFTLMISVWHISEIDILQFLTGSRYFIGSISYFLLPLSVVPFLKFLSENALKEYKNTFKKISIIIYMIVIVLMLLQFSGLVYLINFFAIVLGVVLITILYICYALIKETIRKNQESIKLLKYMSVLLGVAFLELFAFFSQNFNSISSFLGTGLLIFITLLLIDSVLSLNNILALEGEANALRKLAYRDILTNGFNRQAFERDVDQYLENDNIKSIALVIADINYLKQINDTFGHTVGDDLIITTYQMLDSLFEDFGRVYRLGGDEFACLVAVEFNFDYHEVLKVLEELETKQIKDRTLAIGHGLYSKSSPKTFSEFMHEVDISMYRNKRRIKSRN